MSAATFPPVSLDIPSLLEPIPGGDPAGENIRFGVEHDQIKDARREEADLPQGVWKADRKRAEWGEVVRIGTSVLRDRSKDLQVVAWLCEALLGRHGVAGLTAGFDLATALLRRYGEALHPRPDEDDQSRRALIFEWLNGRLIVQLLTLPLTVAPADRESGFTFGDFLNAQRLSATPSKETKAPKGGPAPVTLQLFNATVKATPVKHYQDIYQSLVQAAASLSALKEALDAVLGAQAPSMSDLAQRIGELGQWVYTTLSDRGESPADDAPASPPEQPAAVAKEAAPAGKTEPVAVAAGPRPSEEAPRPMAAITNRREAYRQLAEIADFLAKTEPHSPTPYLLQRILQWRDMPLPALLVELSRGRKDATALFEILGLTEGKP